MANEPTTTPESVPVKPPAPPESTPVSKGGHLYQIESSMLNYSLEPRLSRLRGEQVSSEEFVGASGITPDQMEKNYLSIGAIVLVK
jgi:hypothetical protein